MIRLPTFDEELDLFQPLTEDEERMLCEASSIILKELYLDKPWAVVDDRDNVVQRYETCSEAIASAQERNAVVIEWGLDTWYYVRQIDDTEPR